MTTANGNLRTRELWLEDAIEALRPRFTEVGLPLPERVHVSVGFGYGAKRESAKILGQCWKREASDDGVNHIFISPEIADTGQVLATLLHELIHAADNNDSGHKGKFAEAATRLGLEGRMTATTASVELAAEFMCLAETLGDYPHGALHPVPVAAPTPVPAGGPLPPKVHSGPRKQGTRMLKLTCGHCGYTVRTTAKWLERGMPRCPAGEEMSL
ncbi:SprT-like domain-containing protein [Saccharopolyspora sp. WRP15-2]|uniref:SprT-like domain-containing protein n=1 Tax=Saccharopolyspora oryzae TaxID=2997343 RepID=A0ABT4USY8_9PSEU|nr:SprT-like domain-containing protein [Saccharopolyspora oryzae]MDA3624234.1 SprT-like domain-containing protein [Saccharopolyspora oryzae]